MKQILIVEDDSFLNKMLDYNLTADGYGVTSALNARTAADAIRQREFDLVLLDINLPDGNGFELCKLIKPQHPDTIVIFLTVSPMEYKMLNLFRKNPRQVLTRGQLLEKLWDIDERFVDEHTLTTSISRIRSKIEADGGAPYIKTVYGMGYQWTGGEVK